MFKIELSKLNELFKAVSKKMPIYMPVKNPEGADYDLWEDGKTFAYDVTKTVRSPKDLFFPQSEELMKFRSEGKKLFVEGVVACDKPYVLFGVKACDNKSFEILDRVFLSEPVDTYYKSRRDNGIVVTLVCNRPEASCFCSAFGIDTTNPGGDAVTYIHNDYLYIKELTPKGFDFVESVRFLLQDANENDLNEDIVATKEILKKLPFASLDLSSFGKDGEKLFDSKEWATLSQGCLGCGACTFVCPTCQCFDIRDFNTNKGVIRYRCWDSCMYSDFTQMAGGNNRTTQLQRFRQRFMHKLVYYPENNDGLFSCVGCGRCVNKCPQHLNIVKVIKALGGKNE